MSAQVLSGRSLRRIERDAKVPLVRGWALRHHVYGFVTADHHHGEWDRRDHSVYWWPRDRAYGHFSSCRDLPPFMPHAPGDELIEMRFKGGPMDGVAWRDKGLPRTVTHCPSCAFCDAGMQYARGDQVADGPVPAWLFTPSRREVTP